MAGALPAEEYKTKLEKAGFRNVAVTVTKPHELNREIVRNFVKDMSERELLELDGLSASALITAVK